MKLTLYLAEETDLARKWAKSKTGAEAFWAPRSVTPRVTKFAPVSGELRRCEVEIEDWWLRQRREKAQRELTI